MAGLLDKALATVGLARKSLYASTDLTALLGGSVATASGASVNATTALQATAVAAATRLISEAFQTMPLAVYRRGEDNAREKDTDHPAHELLRGFANPWTSAPDLRQQLTQDSLLHGDGYAAVVRVGGEPRELHRLTPTAVSIDMASGEPAYVYQAGTERRRYAFSDVLHLRAPLSHDGIKGESPIKLAREAIGLSIVMERHAARLFGRGARPAGLLEHPGKLSESTAAALKASWDSVHSGSDNGAGTAVLEEGMKFNPLTFSSVDAQFLEVWKHQVDEVARAFGVPPSMLFELGRATWGNTAEMGQAFVTYALLPYAKRWEAAIARALFTPEERSTHFAEFNFDGFQRANFAQRTEGYSKLINARVLNPNEVRAMENLAPYVGGEEFINPAITAANDNTPQKEPARDGAA